MGIIDLLAKGVKFARSDTGKKIGKGILNFTKNSGLGKKVVGAVSKKIAKKTGKHPALDAVRQVATQKGEEYFGSGNNKGIAANALNEVRESGLGTRALAKAHQSLANKSDKRGFHTLLNIAATEGQNYISKDYEKYGNKPGDLTKKMLMEPLLHPQMYNPPAGKQSQRQAPQTPRMQQNMYNRLPRGLQRLRSATR